MSTTELHHQAAIAVMGWTLHEGRYLNADGHTVMLVEEWEPSVRWDHAGMIAERMYGLQVKMRAVSNWIGLDFPLVITRSAVKYMRPIGDAASDPHEM